MATAGLVDPAAAERIRERVLRQKLSHKRCVGNSRLGLMISGMVVRLLYLGMIRLFSGWGC
ncbi:hypothetical protein [Plantactinospora endophytica]|uniref:Uncharacterized protein n=1 Tax=Plantactinospora endophytica TaxID=673535 RepID=A0ABQ4EFT0_9ACTN|nr:hypothetical protein [Plantactinospora endophytica]GIG93107.1 hypothetical protein Pen02_80430 [Plantactinospora endophytica]